MEMQRHENKQILNWNAEFKCMQKNQEAETYFLGTISKNKFLENNIQVKDVTPLI